MSTDTRHPTDAAAPSKDSYADGGFLFDVSLEQADPIVTELIRREAERQRATLILIPSESLCMGPVAEALSSTFGNIYCEGYPGEWDHGRPDDYFADIDMRQAQYRRRGDRRYYKGCELANVAESLAKRRIAECFATPQVPAERIWANVQPLSGAPANLAVYEALIAPGDTIMGLSLNQGGHLSHGSSVSITGRHYKSVPYTLDEQSERLDYDKIRATALEHRPKVIVAGFSSYPYSPDWARFRAIADEVGAWLLADVAHPAGLIVGGAFPSPVGFADVVTFTTHKTMNGARGAVILTFNEALAAKIDKAVFPGLQGGPHENTIAALAVAFGLARSAEFKALAARVVENAKAFATAFTDMGVRVPYGGTESHLLLIDVRGIPTPNGVKLNGETAVSALERAGIVANRNTIPGDKTSANASGVRIGTPWISQRGMKPAGVRHLAGLMVRLLKATSPYTLATLSGTQHKAKIDPVELDAVRAEVAALCDQLADKPTPRISEAPVAFAVRGGAAATFAQQLVTADVGALSPGQGVGALSLAPDGAEVSKVAVVRVRDDEFLFVPGGDTAQVTTFGRHLAAHAEGVARAANDLRVELDGPVVVTPLYDPVPTLDWRPLAETPRIDVHKPYFLGQAARFSGASPAEGENSRAPWSWNPPQEEIRRTPLYDTHKALGGRMVPFAGWSMPVQYAGIAQEHAATRAAGALYDVSHMACFEVSGPEAADFLDLVQPNALRGIGVGRAAYSFLLDPQGAVIDDLYAYHVAPERWILVVNAANEAKDYAWLEAVNGGDVLIDEAVPDRRRLRPVRLRNLRDEVHGADRLALIAFQGPKTTEVLLGLASSGAERREIHALVRNDLCAATIAGIPLIVSRTGYTGEPVGYELFVHPDRLVELWNVLLKAGEPLGIVPAGLGARDSTRTEAGLPLYGHELAGPHDISPIGAGLGGFLKPQRPYFIGREALFAAEAKRKRRVVSFAVATPGARPVRAGDAVVRGDAEVGVVTSCAFLPDKTQIGLAYVDISQAGAGDCAMAPKRDGARKPAEPIPATMLAKAPKPKAPPVRPLDRRLYED